MSAASGGAVDFFGREMNKKISPLTRNELAKELMSEQAHTAMRINLSVNFLMFYPMKSLIGDM